MDDFSNCKHCVAPDAAPIDFRAERRRFLNGLLPVRRHTVTISFQKSLISHVAVCKTTARFAV